ncbi:MAG: hypothetical protein NWF06_01615 [Candidatus Bathyarchaeota archaeon]|nr:hypothetical protein [Candidatus Bathyarchaeum sp.]
MKKMIIFSIVIIVTILSMVTSNVTSDQNGFAIGPAQLDVTVPANGSVTTYVYITSYIDGELVVGTENLAFSIEPNTIQITPTDLNRKVEITVHGNASLAAAQYSGKLTFLLHAGNNVAYGVKTGININQEGGSKNESDWIFTDIIEPIQQNLFVILVVAGIVIALTMGIFIGKRTKKTT